MVAKAARVDLGVAFSEGALGKGDISTHRAFLLVTNAGEGTWKILDITSGVSVSRFPEFVK